MAASIPMTADSIRWW